MIAILHKTRQTRVLNTILSLATGALLLVLLLHSKQALAPIDTVSKTKYEALASFGAVSIPVDIADTSSEQELGLSGTVSLAQNTGKLFVFNTPGRYGFWMKNMNYPIDIIWIDKDLIIVGISKNVTPESYPAIFYPPKDIKYVLEVNAGFSTIHNLSVNQLLTISNNLFF